MRARIKQVLLLALLASLPTVESWALLVRGPQTYLVGTNATLRIVNDSTNVITWRSLSLSFTNTTSASGAYKFWWQRSAISNLVRAHSYTNKYSVVEIPEGCQYLGLNDAYVFQNISTNTLYLKLDLEIVK